MRGPIMATKRTARIDQTPQVLTVDSLAHDGRGVARSNGKTVFIHGALPGESVQCRLVEHHRDYDVADVITILQASPERAVPPCNHYGICGGCSLQHLSADAQILAKQQILLDTLRHLAKIEPENLLPPLRSPALGYRRKARLGVKYVPAKGRVLIGFRERHSHLLADIQQCEVIHPKVGKLLPDLSAMIGSLTIRQRLPQIEVAIGDNVTVLVFRVLVDPSDADNEIMRKFADDHDLQVHLQASGPDSVKPLQADYPPLIYRHPDFDLEMAFHPLDFTQVNHEINQRMVHQAIDWLAPQPHEQVLDLFCGLGNFTLPLARHARQVVGVEADAGLLARAGENARRNGLNNVSYVATDLYDAARVRNPSWLQTSFDAALLDPPRSGAREVIPILAQAGIARLLYVSCHPGSLARDAGTLVNDLGYRLVRAGVMDMFPHTSHVESMALFIKA